MNTLAIVRKLCAANAVSGNEKNIVPVIKELLAPVADKVTFAEDVLHNLSVCFPCGKKDAKKLMLAAHADEIGFIVTSIDEKGFVGVSKLGGIDAVAAAYSHVRFANGVSGVIFPVGGTKPQDITPDKLRVDIGAKNKKEALRYVAIGDTLSLDPVFTSLKNGRLAARPLDDRIGCAVLVELLLTLKAPAYDVYAVFTAQEEVGCRGAGTAAFAVMPDFSIAVDVTGTGDAPGADASEVKLGGGAAIKIKDASVICSELVVDALTGAAKENKIPFQYEILKKGGTDTSRMQAAGAGCHAGCVSVPTRAIHTGVETVDMHDVASCVRLLAAVAENGSL